jgi:RNA polymerase sigma factor (sigma-70 family)
MLVSLLSDEEQELYRMKYIERIPLTEIAKRLGISTPAAAKRTSRLRQRIKELIKKQQLFENEVIL